MKTVWTQKHAHKKWIKFNDLVVCNMRILKHFAPSDIFWSGDIEAIRLLGVLKNFETKIYIDFELYQFWISNFLY